MNYFIGIITLSFLLITQCASESNAVMQSGYVKVDDGQLFFQKFGSGDPIVVLHGGPGMGQNYLLPQMLELAKDHELIFYDQRGSGKSLDTEISPQYINIERFTQDLEQLRLGLGLKKFTLIGHSWGCKFAINYSAKHPDTISSLILLNPGWACDKGKEIFFKEFAKKSEPIKNSLEPFFKYEDFEKLSDQEIHNAYKILLPVCFYGTKNLEYLTLKMNKISELHGFRCREILNSARTNLFPALQSLKAPTLIVHGNQDFVPKQTVQEIKDAIPDAQIVYLEQCGHFSHVERPKELFSAIRKFLASLHSK